MVPYSWLCQARRFFFISAFAPLLRLASCGADEETSTPPPAETASAAPTPTLTATDSPKSNIGSGPVFSDPWGVAVAVDGKYYVSSMAFPVVEFLRQGYKIRKVFG